MPPQKLADAGFACENGNTSAKRALYKPPGQGTLSKKGEEGRDALGLGAVLKEPRPLELLPRRRRREVLIGRRLKRALHLPRANLDGVERGGQVGLADGAVRAVVRVNAIGPVGVDLALEADAAEEVLAPRDDRLALVRERGVVVVRARGGRRRRLVRLANLLRQLPIDLVLLVVAITRPSGASRDHVVPALGALRTASVAEETEELHRARLANPVLVDRLGEISATDNAAVLGEVLRVAHERHVDADLAKAEELLEDRAVVLHDRVRLDELLEVVLVPVVMRAA